MRRRRKAQRAKISAIDTRFFEYLHQVKIARLDQINRDVYHYDNITALYRRMSKLEAVGYLAGRYDRTSYVQKMVHLTDKAFREFVSTGGERAVTLKSNAMTHDTGLVDIRHRFLTCPAVMGYHTENSMQCWPEYFDSGVFFWFVQLRSDAVAEIKLPQQTVRFAVEYEASGKDFRRYRDVVHRYYSVKEIPAVLYICGTTAIMKRIMSTETDHFGTEQPKILYTTLQELGHEGQLILTTRKGDRLILGEQ